jgi:hypothetical protein
MLMQKTPVILIFLSMKFSYFHSTNHYRFIQNRMEDAGENGY